MNAADRELKALALAAQRHGSPMFRTDVPPERILALLAEKEALLARVETLQAAATRAERAYAKHHAADADEAHSITWDRLRDAMIQLRAALADAERIAEGK